MSAAPIDEAVAKVGDRTPLGVLRASLRQAVAGLDVAICLHRIADARRPTDWQPFLTIPAAEADALIELLLSTRPESSQRWLSVTFDDGYRDAVEYIDSRAARFPSVEFIAFICPEKVEQRAGYRWDLVERLQREGATREETAAMAVRDLNVVSENRRPELTELAASDEFALATLEQLRALQRHPNVRLGNHTNTHFKLTMLSPRQVEEDVRRSFESFERLFGRQEHFAFPFGSPGYEFDGRHVKFLRELGTSILWSTERRPYRPSERGPGAVLPRFAVNGTWTHRAIAAWMIARTGVFRVIGSPHRFPL